MSDKWISWVLIALGLGTPLFFVGAAALGFESWRVVVAMAPLLGAGLAGLFAIR